MAELKLTYGKDSNGRLVHVNDVPSGLACDCTCPECGALLIARKGKKNQHHFAHANGADCAGARMTALHMLAQQIIQDERKIRKPHFKEYCEDVTKIIEFSSVELEVHFKTQEVNRRPDCVGIILKGDKRIEVWIEIKVTHEVDEEKLNDIQHLGVICMEVNLSGLLDTDYTIETIREALFVNIGNKKWINYPQLFKKNANAKAEKEREEAEKNQKQLDELAKERTKLEEIIHPWLKFGTRENANKIIQLIKNDPYNKQNNSVTIRELLIPNNDFISWIKRSPKNLDGLELFYVVAKFYSKQIAYLEVKDIDNELKKYRFKDSIDEIEQIELEELVSLRVICRLRRTYDRNIDYPVDHIKEWYKKYITNKCFRNNCLKILSVEYGHIIGSNSTNFIELTEEIYNTSPDILPLYLMALDYRHQTQWPKYNIPPLDDEVIVKCREYVANRKEDKENEYSSILNLAYGYIFKVKSYIPNTDVELDSQIATDMPYSKNMSFEELVEGFAKIGEELNKQQY